MSGWNWSWNNSSNNNTSNSSNSNTNSGFNWSWNSTNKQNNNNSRNNNNNTNAWSWNANSNTNNNNNNNGWNFSSSSNSNSNSSSSWNWNSSNNNNNNNNKNNNNNSWNFNSNSSSNSNTNAWNFNTSNQSNNDNNFSVRYNANNPLSVIKKLADEYVPHADNPTCRFETILYNKVPKGRNFAFEKPPFVRAVLWDKFVANNPDSNHLVPVAVRGYTALHDRSKLCLAGHVSAIKSYTEVMDKINELKYNIDKKMRDQILELKQIQINLSYRLLVILKTYVLMSVQQQQLNNRNHNNGNNREVMTVPRLNVNEKEMKRRLDDLMKQTRNLYLVMGNVDKSIHSVSTESNYNHKRMNIQRNVVHQDTPIFIEPNNKKAIFNFLHDQTKILSQLSKTVQKDMDDLNIIKNGIISAHKRVMLQ